jgi:hypothetical protein
MDAEFSIELGREDPVLDFPWEDPSGKFAYRDLKRRPDLIASIDEAAKFPELREFLEALNSPTSVVETAKCDAWLTTELSEEESIYEASHKFASYVDVVLSDIALRMASIDHSLAVHEQFARALVELVRRAPDGQSESQLEICVRRCYFGEKGGVREGCYFTLYVSGYANDGISARRNWSNGLKIVENAIVRLSGSALSQTI